MAESELNTDGAGGGGESGGVFQPGPAARTAIDAARKVAQVERDHGVNSPQAIEARMAWAPLVEAANAEYESRGGSYAPRTDRGGSHG